MKTKGFFKRLPKLIRFQTDQEIFWEREREVEREKDGGREETQFIKLEMKERTSSPISKI